MNFLKSLVMYDVVFDFAQHYRLCVLDYLYALIDVTPFYQPELSACPELLSIFHQTLRVV